MRVDPAVREACHECGLPRMPRDSRFQDQRASCCPFRPRTTRQHMQSLDTEIEGFQKSITQEEERNELLTALLGRARMGQAATRQLIANSQAQQEALQAQYSTYARTLQETEQTLSRHAAVKLPLLTFYNQSIVHVDYKIPF